MQFKVGRKERWGWKPKNQNLRKIFLGLYVNGLKNPEFILIVRLWSTETLMVGESAFGKCQSPENFQLMKQ